MDYGDFSNPKSLYQNNSQNDYLNQPDSINTNSDSSSFCNERLNAIITSIGNVLSSTFTIALSNGKEYGGIIIEKEGTEIKVNEVLEGQKDKIYLDFGSVPGDYLIAGEFHTHQYTLTEVENENVNRKTKSFDGNGVGFDSQDLYMIKKRVKKGYTAIIEAGSTRLALVIYEESLAERFLSTQRSDASGYSVDAEVDNELDWDLKEGKVEGIYATLRWDRFKQLLNNYVDDTKRETGIIFYKSTNLEKTTFESNKD